MVQNGKTSFFSLEELEIFRASLPAYRQWETFVSLGVLSWDVVAALLIVKKYPRTVVSIHVSEIASYFGYLPGQENEMHSVENGLYPIVPTHALAPDINLDRPLLGAEVDILGERYRLILDGRHRIYKAAHQGRERLLCAVLTAEEELFCRTSGQELSSLAQLGLLPKDQKQPMVGMQTPDGTIAKVQSIVPGVFWVDTGSHGFLVLSQNLAQSILSPQACAIGVRQGRWMFFEEDIAVAAPLFEHPEWGMWPGFRSGQHDYEQILRRWCPTYFTQIQQLTLTFQQESENIQ